MNLQKKRGSRINIKAHKNNWNNKNDSDIHGWTEHKTFLFLIIEKIPDMICLNCFSWNSGRLCYISIFLPSCIHCQSLDLYSKMAVSQTWLFFFIYLQYLFPRNVHILLYCINCDKDEMKWDKHEDIHSRDIYGGWWS